MHAPETPHAGALQNINSGFSHSEGEFVEGLLSNFCYKKGRTFRNVLTTDFRHNQKEYYV
jgi:hypothetical protein